MTPLEFRAWKARLALSYAQVSNALGISPRLAMKYTQGALAVPKPIAKLCAMIEERENGK